MCLIVTKPKGVVFDNFLIDNIFHIANTNRHGLGVAYKNNEGIYLKKGLISPEYIVNFLTDVGPSPEDEIMVHGRICTAGDIIDENAHPFVCETGLINETEIFLPSETPDSGIKNTLVMAHNGGMNYSITDRSKSDTWHVVNQKFSNPAVRTLFYKDPQLFAMIADGLKGGSRLSFMSVRKDTDMRYFGNWVKDDSGLWFSHSGYKRKQIYTIKETVNKFSDVKIKDKITPLISVNMKVFDTDGEKKNDKVIVKPNNVLEVTSVYYTRNQVDSVMAYSEDYKSYFDIPAESLFTLFKSFDSSLEKEDKMEIKPGFYKVKDNINLSNYYFDNCESMDFRSSGYDYQSFEKNDIVNVVWLGKSYAKINVSRRDINGKEIVRFDNYSAEIDDLVEILKPFSLLPEKTATFLLESNAVYNELNTFNISKTIFKKLIRSINTQAKFNWANTSYSFSKRDIIEYLDHTNYKDNAEFLQIKTKEKYQSQEDIYNELFGGEVF